MRKVLLVAAVALVLAVPAQGQGSATQTTFELVITVPFVAVNICTVPIDTISGIGDLRLRVHSVDPNNGSPAIITHTFDKLRATATGTPSGLTYNITGDGQILGANGVTITGSGAVVFQDENRVIFDPIGAGSQGGKFKFRVHQGFTITPSEVTNFHVQTNSDCLN